MREVQIQMNSKKTRQELLKLGFWLEIATIVWNLVEATVAVIFGSFAGSTALIGFGIDSLIETLSAAIVGWRLQMEIKSSTFEAVNKTEAIASKIAGCLLFALAVYVIVDAGRHLLGFREHAQTSLIGIALTAAALFVMPFLAKAKLKVAEEINSKALKADAMESACCGWFAFATLVGLILNITFHWWWADPVAGLVLVPLMVREGFDSMRNEDCSCHKNCSSS